MVLHAAGQPCYLRWKKTPAIHADLANKVAERDAVHVRLARSVVAHLSAGEAVSLVPELDMRASERIEPGLLVDRTREQHLGSILEGKAQIHWPFRHAHRTERILALLTGRQREVWSTPLVPTRSNLARQ